MNITIEEMITQINSDDIAQEHEFQVLAEVRKTKFKAKSAKNLVDRIQIVEKVVLYNQQKEFTLGQKSNSGQINDIGDNKDNLENIGLPQTKKKSECFDSVSVDPSKEISEEQKNLKDSNRNLDIFGEDKKEDSQSNSKDGYFSNGDYQEVPQSDHLKPYNSFRGGGEVRSSRDNLISAHDSNSENKEGLTDRVKQEVISNSSSRNISSNQGLEENSNDNDKSTPSGKSGKLLT